AAGRQRCFLFLLIVFVRDDLDALGKRHQAIEVIAVTVRNDGRLYRLRRDFGDFGEEILRSCLCLLGIDNDDARLSDDDRAVSTATAEPSPYVGFQHFHRNRRWRLWSSLRHPQNGKPATHNQSEPETTSL